MDFILKHNGTISIYQVFFSYNKLENINIKFNYKYI